jgi:hypothetical protein
MKVRAAVGSLGWGVVRDVCCMRFRTGDLYIYDFSGSCAGSRGREVVMSLAVVSLPSSCFVSVLLGLAWPLVSVVTRQLSCLPVAGQRNR